MRKLFVFTDQAGPYAAELRAARERVDDDTRDASLADLRVDGLEREGVEVVVSNGLPPEWYYTLKGMGVATVTIDENARYFGRADITIDPLCGDERFCFTGPEHSVAGNRDFDVAGVVNLVSRLPWDSEFFGFNVAFLSCMNLTETIYGHVDRFIHAHDIRLVEYLCNCHNPDTVRVAEAKGFSFTDIRLSFARRLTHRLGQDLPAGLRFGRAGEEHVPALQGIAGDLYVDSRYWFDSGFDRDKVKEFYRGWVEKGVRGQYDHECFALFAGEAPGAFCTLRYNTERTASIGLFGLAPEWRGKGLGKRLLAHVFNHLLERGVEEVGVVTQGRNYAAQNLYQSMGFRTKRTQLWYHKWI
jgi:ribosomal protein S18 acetylase RimI-like enzyme